MSSRALAVGMVALLAAGSLASGAELFVDAFKYSDPAFQTNIQVNLADVPGATAVQAVMASGSLLALDPFGSGGYGKMAGPYAAFADFRTATVGNWQLKVTLGGSGTAVYDFAVNDYRSPFTTNSFPPAPTMISPTDGATGVAPTPTFLWNNGGVHTGPLESLFVSTWSEVNPAIGEFTNSSGGTLGLNDTSWTPATVVLPAGLANFLVQYETNEREDANVGDPVFNAAASTVADPRIVWTSSSGDLFSRDLVQFTVVPEPATLALLAAGGLGLLARRRR